jgi:hypothetical protein
LSHETYVLIGEARMVTFPMGAAEIRADAVRTVRAGCAATENCLSTPLCQL